MGSVCDSWHSLYASLLYEKLEELGTVYVDGKAIYTHEKLLSGL